MSVYIGIDPSYSKTGLTIWNESIKHIDFFYISPEGSNDTYKDKICRALYIYKKIAYYAYEAKQNTYMIIEEPLITSMKSSALSILSGVLSSNLITNNIAKEIYTINPSVVSSVNKNVPGRTKKNRKQISLQVALLIIDYLSTIGYTYTIHNDKTNKDGTMKQRKLTPDEAESFIMTILLLKSLNALSSETESGISKLQRGLNKTYQINLLGECMIQGDKNE